MTQRDESFGLYGELEGRHLTLPLAVGSHRLGSAQVCEIRLAHRGISRFHARLEVGPDAVVLEDLGSKNGTTVNGRRVERADLVAGDEIRLGELRLVLARLDRRDTELAIVAEDGSSPTTKLSLAGETSLLSRGASPDPAGLAWLEEVLRRLTATAKGDLDAALDAIACGLEAEAAAWLEWPCAGSRATVLAALGPPSTLPGEAVLRRACRRRRDRIASHFGRDGSRVVLETQAGSLFGLVLWTTSDVTAWEPALRLLVLLASRWRGETQLMDSAGAGREGEALKFPAGILPGRSPAMRELYRLMRPLVASDLPVLISGETGVGKEHLARTLHASSPRAGGPFVAINCAAIPADLLEAELFGIAKGVATGVEARAGRVLDADGGTLFLDEIGDMPMDLQAKVLRMLQEKTVQPVGAGARRVDVRLLSASNADLEKRIEDGTFRLDLYYRLAGARLEMPPLRRRAEDIPGLVAHFIDRFKTESGISVRGMTVMALRALLAHRWPGNVRELEHEVRRLVYCCGDGQAIDSRMVSRQVSGRGPVATSEAGEPDEPSLDIALQDHLEGLERRVILAALKRAEGNQSEAARLLQVSRNGLAKRLKRLGILARDFEG